MAKAWWSSAATRASTGITAKPSWRGTRRRTTGSDGCPYVLINVQALNPAGSTLVHELLHTTGLENRDHDNDPKSVFYDNSLGSPSMSRTLSKAHAERLRRAYFAESR